MENLISRAKRHSIKKDHEFIEHCSVCAFRVFVRRYLTDRGLLARLPGELSEMAGHGEGYDCFTAETLPPFDRSSKAF